ncbi:MAG: hybrid sensor histidine kinase/response regulator [Archangium sp.]|nr:hybrid sensor histidine kinase/response regulator [Archangium sp.]
MPAASPRLLIIDDDSVDRMGIRRALAEVGHVDEAADAATALELLKNGQYDLAVVDYFLPPLLGPEVLSQLREAQPGLAAIFLSGAGGEDVAAEAIKSGAEDYVPKTMLLKPEQLRKVVHTALQSGRLRVETERTRARLELAVEAARLGTWSYDPKSRQFQGDARFEQLLGLSPGGVWSHDVVLAVFSESERATFVAALEKGEVALQLLVGQAQWVDLRGRRERHAPRSVFGTALDVSVQKNEERRSSSLREQLMGVASHDLKNPLSAVKQASTLLAKSPNLDERERRFVSHIRSSAERMNNLIVQLLDLTRVRLGGGLPIVRQKVAVHALIESVVDELRLAFDGRVIEVKADTADVDIDPDRFAQVASNLIGNALRHSPDDSSVDVALSVEPRHLILTVHNQGEPISAEAQKLIFEPFVQLGDRALRDGLGLGLHITREIVRAHGGSVSVTSSAQAGTQFTVHLPR